MFCSAPDEGKFTKLNYPSGPWSNEFIRIGAAHADGRLFQLTSEEGITYAFPGVDVVQDQARGSSSTGRVKEPKYQTGSDVATALAAGLAAMEIYCVKVAILTAKMANQNKAIIDPIPNDQAIQVAHPKAMKRAFAGLGTLTSTRFIQVWDELDKASGVLETWNRSGLEVDVDVDVDCTAKFMQFVLRLTSRAK